MSERRLRLLGRVAVLGVCTARLLWRLHFP